jgi:hypothetical protein
MNWKNTNIKLLFLLALAVAGPQGTKAQNDTTKPALILNISYHMNDNNVMYLIANTKAKISGKFKQVQGIPVSVYLDKETPDQLVGNTITDANGTGKLIFPVTLQAIWNGAAQHQLLGISKATKEFESASSETAVTKSRLTIDTLSEGETRTITAVMSAFNGTDWVPAADVECKVGVARSGGSLLPAGDEATYTTDSTGKISAELMKKNLPGDENGNLVLVATVEENDIYGNLKIQKVVPWGVAVKPNTHFFEQRTLWSTRFRTPIWLLAMAISIMVGVWGTIIYLIFQLVKVKKLGT